jgi:hypothetical protein
MPRPVIKPFYVSHTAAIISATLRRVDNQMTSDKYLAPWPRRLTLSTAGTKSLGKNWSANHEREELSICSGV